MFLATTALKKIKSLTKRLRIIQGGSSAGKTIAILLILIDKAQKKGGTLSSVVSETMPHLKRGAIRDFLSIMETHGYFDEDRWNKTDYIYTFETGSKIEFFSADSSDKVRGPRRNGDLFLNECNNISYDTYTQLAIRTEGTIWCDYNPVAEFWVNDEIIAKKVDHDFLILTYKDNEGLPQSIVDEIESRKESKNFWRVFGEGLLGEAEGRIFTGWNVIDDIPHEAQLERYGLDFGYTNDETAIVALYYHNGGYIWDEITYQKGLSNKQIADILLNVPRALVVADSSEPKSIDEIKGFGVNIVGVEKTRGETKSETFVKWSIGVVQSERISITKRSVNGIKEYRNLLWLTDKNGKILNVEEPACKNHLMAAGRYAMVSLIPLKRREEYLKSLPVFEMRPKPNPAR